MSCFHEAKAKAGIPLDTPLGACTAGTPTHTPARHALTHLPMYPSWPAASLGACMSGFMESGPQGELKAALAALDPHLVAPGPERMYIDNDSPGSVFTAAGKAGGLVIIAGTGTMGQLILPRGQQGGGLHIVSCGGHGHMYGDEGSAYWIAAAAIRRIHYADDGYSASATAPLPDVTRARAAMHRYFNMADNEGMLEVMYKVFAKDRVAGFTRHLAALARGGADGQKEDGSSDSDAFCASLFSEAGALLGHKVRALAPHALSPGAQDVVVHGLTIVAVGSVWKSWDLLKESFLSAATAPFTFLPSDVRPSPSPPSSSAPAPAPAPGATRRLARTDVTSLPAEARGRLASFRIVQLKVSSAVGAAWRGAQLGLGRELPLDSEANCSTLFVHA